MNTGNLIQITQDELMEITNVGNKKTVREALKELQEQGFIAVKLKGNTRRGTIFMVNPQVAQCGAERPGMERNFWMLTGTVYDSGRISKYSKPHDTWNKKTKKRNYSIGYGKQDTTKGEIRFAKINEPKIHINNGSSVAPSEPEDELPFRHQIVN